MTGNSNEFDAFWKDSESVITVKVQSSIRVGHQAMRVGFIA